MRRGRRLRRLGALKADKIYGMTREQCGLFLAMTNRGARTSTGRERPFVNYRNIDYVYADVLRGPDGVRVADDLRVMQERHQLIYEQSMAMGPDAAPRGGKVES